MKVKSLKLKVKSYGVIFLIIFLLLTFHFSLVAAEWPGVDESVIEKHAKEYGREAREPLINTDQGNLLLFAFLLAGALGGFVAGYYWRTLTEPKRQSIERHSPAPRSRAGRAQTDGTIL